MAKKPYVWDGSSWVELSIGMPQLAYSSASPNSPFIGQIWVDTSSSVSALNPLEFLSLANASAIYLSQENASATYLTQSTATNTYLPISATATLSSGYVRSFLLGGM